MSLDDEEIGTLTHHKFSVLLERKRLADKQEFLRTGMICAAVVNFSMGHPDKAVPCTDWIPKYLQDDDEDRTDLRNMTAEQQEVYILNQLRKRVYSQK